MAHPAEHEIDPGWKSEESETALVAGLASPPTSGHTHGHMVYEDLGTGLLFTGDHLLPRITPSIAFEHVPEHSPLTSYLESLQLFADEPDLRMLPAHGLAAESARDRARELLVQKGEDRERYVA